jgi:hypothetical protein
MSTKYRSSTLSTASLTQSTTSLFSYNIHFKIILHLLLDLTDVLSLDIQRAIELMSVLFHMLQKQVRI